ncbi:family 1 extracellular solute-binding protein [Desulfovibrio sp. X2]|uniref:substrate-binding domain-containing protein n=1 Tax=Desulfovibrio sp. X2 TaxID=941449 RepID=UPI0003588A37|nr:substrate-binding domain-containing protein [Desulfovibrio sp. X2]EPR41086.1 family 1 extracellular solute-binding protein [Desulfovibrio sp. X2]
MAEKIPAGGTDHPGRGDWPVIPDEREADLIGLDLLDHADGPDLVLFLAGNQFMAVPELLEAFRAAHPKVRRIFCETLPPRLELRQILSGGAWFRGRLVTVVPDCWATVSEAGVAALAEAGRTERGQCRAYLRNRVVCLVRAGNPKGVAEVADLARADVVVSQPSPVHEDIAEHILAMYRAAGGEALAARIMEEKREAGTTLLTTVHHRETPERLLAGTADAGPVWATEAAHAAALGLPLEAVEFGEGLDQRGRVRYFLCPVRGGAHPENGRAFMDFVRSPEGRAIYAKYGFLPV